MTEAGEYHINRDVHPISAYVLAAVIACYIVIMNNMYIEDNSVTAEARVAMRIL